MPSRFRMRIKTELLPDGISLKHPVHDEQDRMLLESGTPITASLKQQLLGQGTEWVILHQSDAMEVMGLADESKEASVQPQSQNVTPQRPMPSLGRINAKVDALENTVSLSVENRWASFARKKLPTKGAFPMMQGEARNS